MLAQACTPPRAAEGLFINPVCGIAVSIDHPMHIEQHEGESYRFCCDACRTTFRIDPACTRRFTARRSAGPPP